MADTGEGAMNGEVPAFGPWLPVVAKAGTLVILASSLPKPHTAELSNQGVDS